MRIDYTLLSQILKFHFSINNRVVDESLIRWLFICIHKIANAHIEVAYKQNKKGTLLKIKSSFASIFLSNKSALDLYIPATNTAIEFKFHRKTDNSNNCTTTKVGTAFKDINRLSILENCEKYFIYVFDDQMAGYYSNNSNKSKDFPQYYFDLDCIKTGDTFNINKTTAPSQYSVTFRENAFLGFFKSAQSFNSFGYCMTVEFAGKIPDTEFNMIVYKIT